jgi:hypothetical protein
MYISPKTRKLRAYIGKRERERENRDSEHKDSTNTWMSVVQGRKRERERERRYIMNTQIERTPGTVLRRDVGREQEIL